MRTHAVKWVLLLSVAALCFVAYCGVRGVMGVMDGWTADLPPIEDASFTNYAQESVMYADDGQTVLAQFQLEKRDPVEIDQISPYVLAGTVDTEDVRFYQHEGVDLPGIARALVNNLRGGDLEGASTITQQLVRNTVLTQEANEISFERKVREAELAIDLEKRYSKDEILLMYLNTINYGDGCYGIEAAARNYFQASAADLTLAQAAALVGIPQSPNYLNPKEYPDACLARRNVVLDRMLAAGDITQEEHDAAAAEELGLNPAPDAPADGIYAYYHFTSYVRDLLLKENNPYGCSYADLFEGGLTIYTSLNPDLQEKAEAACAAQRGRMDEALDASVVAIDPATGQVKAMVGGKGDSQVNLATGQEGGGSGRQAGSTFKAFTLAAAIEQGINPQTLIDCTSPMTHTVDGVSLSFENFGGANYGIRSIQSATSVSSNTGYLRLSEKLGQQATTDMAHRLGVKTPFNTVYTTTLGTADVSPLDLASAYAALAAGGVRRDAVVVTKIVDRNGAVIYEAPDTSERAISEEVAGATTKVLRAVFDTSEGTAYDARLANGQPVAGKTGTSSDFADHWLVGYTPSLSVAAWIGNPAGAIRTDTSLTCNALWKDFMDRATEGRPVEQFPQTKDPTYGNAYNAEQRSKLGAAVQNGSAANGTAGSSADEARTDESERNVEGSAAPPDTTGRTFAEAVSLLSGYEAGYLEEYSDTVLAGTVISQSIRDGMVVIVVSLGPKP